MRIGIVLGTVVPVLGMRFFRHQFFQPLFHVRVQPALIVIDEHAGRDVHGVHQDQTFPDPAGRQALLHIRRDIDECAPCWHFHP